MSEADDTPPVGITQIPIPSYWSSSFQVVGSATEVIIIGNQLTAGMGPAGEVGAFPKANVMLSLSPHAAKELAAVLSKTVSEVEELTGALATPYLIEAQKSVG